MICEMLFGVGFGLIDDLGRKDAAVFIGGVISYRLGCGVTPRFHFGLDCIIRIVEWIERFSYITCLFVKTVMRDGCLRNSSVIIVRMEIIPCFCCYILIAITGGKIVWVTGYNSFRFFCDQIAVFIIDISIYLSAGGI